MHACIYYAILYGTWTSQGRNSTLQPIELVGGGGLNRIVCQFVDWIFYSFKSPIEYNNKLHCKLLSLGMHKFRSYNEKESMIMKHVTCMHIIIDIFIVRLLQNGQSLVDYLGGSFRRRD